MVAPTDRCLLFVHGRGRAHGRLPRFAPCPSARSVTLAQEEWESVARRLAAAFRVPVQTAWPLVRAAAVGLAASTGAEPAVCDVEALAVRRLAADLAGRRQGRDR
jgi:hypothetical protein